VHAHALKVIFSFCGCGCGYGYYKSVNRWSVKSVKSVNIQSTWVMKRRRFDFFKGKKYDQMFRSY
jgi:hypothetical protein